MNVQNFIDKECTKKLKEEWINGVLYSFYQMNDDWIAVFEHDNSKLYPVIQAQDINKARSYCVFIEPLRVPVDVINRDW